jgi:arylformamidase
MRFVDLTLPINGNMKGIPSVPEYDENPTRCTVLANLSEAQRDHLLALGGIELAENHKAPSIHMLSRLEILTHMGTHVDAPCHFVDGGLSIDQIPLEAINKKGQVIPLTHVAPKTAVTADDILKSGVEIDSSIIPVLHTGWTERTWGTDQFWDEMIYLGTSAAELLAERGVSAMAMDFFPEAPFWLGIKTGGPIGENHVTLLGNNVIIIQLLTNVSQLVGEDFQLITAPLPLEGLDGSPARVFAAVE